MFLKFARSSNGRTPGFGPGRGADRGTERSEVRSQLLGFCAEIRAGVS
ncbi:MAG: hypothetical protein ACLFTS_03050 [Candidatus Paceibacterota bacterium]